MVYCVGNADLRSLQKDMEKIPPTVVRPGGNLWKSGGDFGRNPDGLSLPSPAGERREANVKEDLPETIQPTTDQRKSINPFHHNHQWHQDGAKKQTPECVPCHPDGREDDCPRHPKDGVGEVEPGKLPGKLAPHFRERVNPESNCSQSDPIQHPRHRDGQSSNPTEKPKFTLGVDERDGFSIGLFNFPEPPCHQNAKAQKGDERGNEKHAPGGILQCLEGVEDLTLFFLMQVDLDETGGEEEGNTSSNPAKYFQPTFFHEALLPIVIPKIIDNKKNNHRETPRLFLFFCHGACFIN